MLTCGAVRIWARTSAWGSARTSLARASSLLTEPSASSTPSTSLNSSRTFLFETRYPPVSRATNAASRGPKHPAASAGTSARVWWPHGHSSVWTRYSVTVPRLPAAQSPVVDSAPDHRRGAVVCILRRLSVGCGKSRRPPPAARAPSSIAGAPSALRAAACSSACASDLLAHPRRHATAAATSSSSSGRAGPSGHARVPPPRPVAPRAPPPGLPARQFVGPWPRARSQRHKSIFERPCKLLGP